MKAAKLMMAMASILLLFAVAVQDAAAQGGGRRQAKEEVEMGGWSVAYSAEMTEKDAAYGNVEPGVSLQDSERDAVRSWADSLVRRATELMTGKTDANAVRSFEQNENEQRDVRRFLVRTVRDMLRGRRAGSDMMDLQTIEVKAGVMEYIDRRDNRKFVTPYVGLRMKTVQDPAYLENPAGQGVGKQQAKEEVERDGWSVGYSAEMTEKDAAYGNVEPGVSLQDSERDAVRSWADSLVRRATELMAGKVGSNVVRGFEQDENEQREVRRFLIKTVRDTLRSRQSGSSLMDLRFIEVKAGVMEYIERRDNRKVIVPYLGLRMKGLPATNPNPPQGGDDGRNRWHRD